MTRYCSFHLIARLPRTGLDELPFRVVVKFVPGEDVALDLRVFGASFER